MLTIASPLATDGPGNKWIAHAAFERTREGWTGAAYNRGIHRDGSHGGCALRRGAFQFQLAAWSERPCVLTIAIPSVASRLRVAGILRAYYSLASTHGWALVPPEQHGGFTALRMTELCLDRATMRAVIDEGGQRSLRYVLDGEAVFTLERDDAYFTGPPRSTRDGRYLYVGGRRRRVPEPWMFA